MIDNRTKSIPTSSSEVGIYYVYISQGNKDNGVYIVSDFVLPITVTKIAELYIGDDDKANLTGGNTFTGNQIINGDITVEDITANNFLGNASTATKLKTFVNINGVAFDGSSNITIYDGTKEATITPGNTSQYFRGDKTWQTLNKIVVGLSNVDNTADANKNVLSATKLTIPRTINNVSFDGSENIVINAIDSTPRIPISYMGIANGVATLDNTGIIPITQLPSYVDDVIEVANYASLPIIGESGKIYVTTNNNKTYRWSGSVYVYITSGAVDSVNGYTGVVVLTKSDFILGNVDNTSDANKPISIATQSALDLKQNLLTLGNFTSTTPGITISNGNGAVIGSGITFNITTAGTTTGGLITSGHWNTFNNKWDSSNHPITTLGYGLPDYPTTLPASDVYSWAKQSTKPTYSYSEITSKPTLLSQFTNDLGNYGSWITGINSGMVTTALGYTPWHSGNHPTTISGYGITDIPTYNGTNFIQNQNTSAQSAFMWISGSAKIDGGLALLNRYDNSANGSIIYNSGSGADFIFAESAPNIYTFGSGSYGSIVAPTLSLNISTRAATFASTVNATQFTATGSNAFNGYNEGWLNLYSSDNSHRLRINNSTTYNRIDFYDQTLDRYADIKANAGEFTGQIKSTVATGTAPLTVNSTTMVGNLNAQYWSGYSDTNNTSPNYIMTQSGNGIWKYSTREQVQSSMFYNLSTNYIPKWNGSNFVNSLISDDGTYINTFGKLDTNLEFKTGSNRYIGFGSVTNWNYYLASSGDDLRVYDAEGADFIKLFYGGGARRVSIPLTTQSTSPTTGALVVGGGMGVGGMISINGNNGNGITISRSGYHTYNTGIDNNGYYVYDVTRADYSTVIAGNGNMSIGYPNDQGYKLAVNGTGYFGGTINATNYIGKSNGFYTVQITQAAYTALGTKDASTIYMIVG